MRIVIEDSGIYMRRIEDGVSTLYPLKMLTSDELMVVRTAIDDALTEVRRQTRKKAKSIAKTL